MKKKNKKGANVTEMKLQILEGKGDHASYRPERHLLLADAKVMPEEGESNADKLKLDVLYRDPEDPERCFQYKVGNLIGDQYYKTKVSGINEEGQGAFSQLSPEVSTLQPTAPSIPEENIVIDDVTPEQVTMHFGKALLNGGSPIAGYIIACRAIGGRERKPETTNSPKMSSFDDDSTNSNENGEDVENINGLKSIKLKDGLLVLPDGYELAGATVGKNATKFVFKRPKIRAFYTFRVCCYNHIGQSEFTTSPPSIQVPSKVEYIAKQQKLKMEKIKAEKKRRAEAKKKALLLAQQQ